MTKPRKCSCIICREELSIVKLYTHYSEMHQNECLQCNKHTTNKFCTLKCAVIYNNSRRNVTNDTKNKISRALIGNSPGNKGKPSPKKGYKKYSRISWCSNCGKYIINSSNQTCSRSCRDAVCSQNGTLKRRILYEGFVYQSTWEVEIAKWLNYVKIEWSQPSQRFKWFDTTLNKKRTYLPDFYLTKFDFYLDVKNPYKQLQDADKLTQLKKLMRLYVGDIQGVKDFVVSLRGLEPPTI